MIHTHLSDNTINRMTEAANTGAVWHIIGAASGKYITSYLYERTARAVADNMLANGQLVRVVKYSQAPEQATPHSTVRTIYSIIRTLDSYEVIGIVSAALLAALMFSLYFGLIV